MDEPIERFDNQDLFDPKDKYDEEDFLGRCEAEEKVISVGEVDCWVAEFNSQFERLQHVKDISEEDLYPVYETMISLFED